MIVHPASVEQAAQLARIHRLCFEEAWTEDFFRRIVADPGVIGRVAARAAETELQAFVLMRTAAEECEILTLATAPDARRHGMARALLVDAAAEAARKQVTAMFLEVAEDNQPALALYRRAGFVANGRRQRYYRRSNGDWVDALMLRANVPLGMGMIGSLD